MNKFKKYYDIDSRRERERQEEADLEFARFRKKYLILSVNVGT